jgi:hypothetical protein
VNEHPADLFTSAATGDHSPSAAGDNTLSVEDVDLGLATSDELDAVSFGSYVVAPYTYFFSLRDSTRVAGLEDTGVRDQYDTEVVPADIYTSTGQPAPEQGTNALSRDEIALGLEPHDLESDPTDDLDALDFGEIGGPYYLSVASVGGSGGADIIRVSDSSSTVALSAADIGLLDSDEVDALVVQDVDGDLEFSAGDYILFSVSLASVGAENSAVRAQAQRGQAAGDIYVSKGDGTHALAVDENELGLRPADDIDALEIRREGPALCDCGDGVLVAPEQCEVGIPCPFPGTICDLTNCTCDEPFCGDGILTLPEQCEPGVVACPAGFLCNGWCQCAKPILCGNNVLDPGEQCDIPFPCMNKLAFCNLANCQCTTKPFCGNKLVDAPGEECDPPKGLCGIGEVCNRLTCECVPDGAFTCPNAVVDQGEECDPLATPTGCEPDENCTKDCECFGRVCNADGVIDTAAGEACDPFAAPNGCEGSEACNSECECALYTQRCGDGHYSPGNEECDLVTVGLVSMDVGCDPGRICNRSDCKCIACIDPDPKAIEVINYDGLAIPVCQIHVAGPDLCASDHYHGAGYGIDESGTDISFVVDPDPSGCGFGEVESVPLTTYLLTGEIACDLLALGVTCILD